MLEELKHQITTIVSVSERDFEHFARLLEVKQLAPKEIWQMEGDIAQKGAFINYGVMRHYYTKDNREATAKFYFPNEWVGDYSSFLTQQASKMNVQALTETEIIIQDYEAVRKIESKLPFIKKYKASIDIKKEQDLLAREYALLLKSPEERYLNLLQQQSELVPSIPSYYIAQYLGIKREQLDDIRKKFSSVNLS